MRWIKVANGENFGILKEGKRMNNNGNGIMGAIYGMAFIGAAVYYIQHAATFWMAMLGVLKALFWPGVLIYKLFELWKI
jgi:hypothetical protein